MNKSWNDVKLLIADKIESIDFLVSKKSKGDSIANSVKKLKFIIIWKTNVVMLLKP